MPVRSRRVPALAWHTRGVDEPSDARGAREVEQLRARFHFLERHGFRVVAQSYEPSAFGNIILDYANDEAWIGLVRDRGQYEVVVARDARDERLSWTTLLESFGEAREAGALVEASAPAEAWAASVARHLPRVQRALAPANYAETLARCRRVAARGRRPWWRFW
jgi:hypothetical protein